MLFNPPLLELLVLAVFFSYFSLKASHASGLLDNPDQRKLHDGLIPLAGGPAIFLTFATAALLFDMPTATTGLILYSTVFAVGLFDDHSNASAILRLIIHLVCGALMAVLCGIVITNVGNLLGFGNIPLLMFAVPLTALAFAGLTNAYNMIDGVDGLASGLALVPLAIVVTLIIQHQSMMPMPLIALVIALLVFMLFNLGPNTKLLSKMFLGDSGSSLLGFIICAVLIYQS
ncbi:undecaprenyl/decaprenyl-phosphate alpha-N-acetylglucosaminyl 1-phosphate transferase [Parahaliea sp. F7430]|uniref:Undecaprenyl/decaprenyl-phosphate alpha-N-acetylglucosaminyl 1-phosphate transferase n=1 Tax=Sediminihaliea albiluteola TaxID=2758564 RepID=A0A7W2TUT4_9GAMM|nr:MraY family glycosyltransferase [Sediminihaliea albiluteola]MBA6412301.1 undecaprenyl/decaprenyl-phosphate alpha-N-acetylglucosaminyl 1-phosphate transferase [Sediminihaliea albiluteola]